MATVVGAVSDMARWRKGQTNARPNSRNDCFVNEPLSIRIPKNESWEADRHLQPSVDTIRLGATFALTQRPIEGLKFWGPKRSAPKTFVNLPLVHSDRLLEHLIRNIRDSRLLADVQPGNQFQVPCRIVLTNIIEQRPTVANHSEQTASARIISGASTHVYGHAVDTIGQEGDLHVGRTCVPFVLLESLQNLQLSVFRDCHSVSWQQGSLKTRETTTKERLSFHDWLLKPTRLSILLKKATAKPIAPKSS
jgi:hypothetical protein